MAPTTFQILVANILPCLSTRDIDAISPPRSRSRTRKIVTATQYQQNICLRERRIMAPTTRRQSRLLELGELPGSPGKSQEDKMDVKQSSVEEVEQKEGRQIRMIISTTTDHTSPTTNISTIPKEEESKQKVSRDTLAPMLKKRTQSMEMTDIIHALDPPQSPEKGQQVKNEEPALHRTNSIISIPDDDDHDDAQPPTDNNTTSASNSDAGNSEDDLEAAFTAELEIDENPTTGPRPTSISTSTFAPPAPMPSMVITPPAAPRVPIPTMVITPPVAPPVAFNPSFQTNTVYKKAEYRPWEMVYMCGECEADVRIRGGGEIRNELSGGNIETLRCRDCGFRILVKKRTKRAVQFEAR